MVAALDDSRGQLREMERWVDAGIWPTTAQERRAAVVAMLRAAQRHLQAGQTRSAARLLEIVRKMHRDSHERETTGRAEHANTPPPEPQQVTNVQVNLPLQEAAAVAFARELARSLVPPANNGA